MAICRRSHRNLVLLILSILVCAHAAFAQARGPKPKPLGSDITGSTSELTDAQKAQVKANVDYYTGLLTAKDAPPEDIETAREGLLQPFFKLEKPSDSFKYEYARMLGPKLDEAMAGSNDFAGTNAAVIASQLSMNQSLTLLLNTCDDPKRKWQIRQMAAKSCMPLLRSQALSGKNVQEAVRRLGASAAKEDNNLILRYMLESMLVAAEHPSLQSAERERLRGGDATDAIVATIDRMAADPNAACPYIDALHTALFNMFEAFINTMTADERQVVSKKLAPALGKGINAARAQWDPAHADPQRNTEYSAFIKMCEDFLKRIDLEVRRDAKQTPQTQLQGAWTNNRKDQFGADAQKWLDVVSKPPYGK